MSAYGKPTDIEIASLKKQELSYDVMRPGNGTPWEDRGALGIVSAFFKTSFGSLFKFPSLVDHIRRPETTGEATGFGMACAGMWAISIAAWDAYQYYLANHFNGDPSRAPIIEDSQFLTESALRVVAVFLAAWPILKLASTLFHSLLTSASQRQIPKVLVHNMFGYALGPSLVTLLPIYVAGWNWAWVLAGAWIVIDAMVGAKTRLYLKTREAVVNIIIATLVCLFLLAAAYTACYFIWPLIMGQYSIHPPEIISKKPMMN
jgi:hypothetical protein